MGRKVFVSYRYGDDNVQALSGKSIFDKTTVRDYVDRLESNLGKTNVYKGEHDGEDLSHLSKPIIENKLKDRMYDSSVTIVMVSPGMKDACKPDEDQWIPWEISYSVKLSTRNGRTSQRNAILAVILPDRNGRYDYATANNSVRDVMPDILRKNINDGYALKVNWDDFQYNRDTWIEKAISARNNTPDYKIHKSI